ncbi:unnamed protein product [Choristocarpus tenellus]
MSTRVSTVVTKQLVNATAFVILSLLSLCIIRRGRAQRNSRESLGDDEEGKPHADNSNDQLGKDHQRDAILQLESTNTLQESKGRVPRHPPLSAVLPTGDENGVHPEIIHTQRPLTGKLTVPQHILGDNQRNEMLIHNISHKDMVLALSRTRPGGPRRRDWRGTPQAGFSEDDAALARPKFSIYKSASEVIYKKLSEMNKKGQKPLSAQFPVYRQGEAEEFVHR